MRIRTVLIKTFGLAGLAAGNACSSGTSAPATGTAVGRGPVGSIAIGSDIQFMSRHNASMNPAVDTIPVGATVTWNWVGALPHNVQSIGSPSFASSNIRTGNGTYAVTFSTPGTYRYDCAVHGAAMSGTIVVH